MTVSLFTPGSVEMTMLSTLGMFALYCSWEFGIFENTDPGSQPNLHEQRDAAHVGALVRLGDPERVTVSRMAKRSWYQIFFSTSSLILAGEIFGKAGMLACDSRVQVLKLAISTKPS